MNAFCGHIASSPKNRKIKGFNKMKWLPLPSRPETSGSEASGIPFARKAMRQRADDTFFRAVTPCGPRVTVTYVWARIVTVWPLQAKTKITWKVGDQFIAVTNSNLNSELWTASKIPKDSREAWLNPALHLECTQGSLCIFYCPLF